MSSVEPSLTTDLELIDAPFVAVPRGPWRDFWGYFSANHGAVAGLVIVIAVLAWPRSPTCSPRIRPTSPTTRSS